MFRALVCVERERSVARVWPSAERGGVPRALAALPRLLLAFGLALSFGIALAPSAGARADTLDDGVRRIAKQLRCPICESVSVADSPADLAVQMRALIRKKLEAGETDQQIITYFVTAYGETVLLEPPRHGLGLAVWLGPIAALALGAGILWLLLRRWIRPARAHSARPAATSENGHGPSIGAWPATGTHRPGEAEPVDAFDLQARQELDALRKGLAK
jgi:cytochrome c-type biogenesis protein CcmH